MEKDKRGDVSPYLYSPFRGDNLGHFEVFDIITFWKCPRTAWDIQARGQFEVPEIITNQSVPTSAGTIWDTSLISAVKWFE